MKVVCFCDGWCVCVICDGDLWTVYMYWVLEMVRDLVLDGHDHMERWL